VARPVYSTQFVAEELSTSTPDAGVIPPLGSIAVIRQIVAYTNPLGIGNELQVLLQPANIVLLDYDHLSEGDNQFLFNGRIVLTPEIYCTVHAVEGTWSVYVGGYLLTDS
jgi:hypothetical protein